MGDGQVKSGTTGKLDTSELRASLQDGPVGFFTTLAYGLRAGKATVYPLLPGKLLNKELPGDTPYWRVELIFEGATRALGFDLIGDALLGRGVQADIDLDEFKALENGVSREHAILRPAKSQLYILDAGSKNGVWVNGVRLSRGQARNVESEFTLRLGGLTGTVQIIDHATLDELKQRVEESQKKGEGPSGPVVIPTMPSAKSDKQAEEQDTVVTTVIDIKNSESPDAQALREAQAAAKAEASKKDDKEDGTSPLKPVKVGQTLEDAQAKSEAAKEKSDDKE